MKFKEGEILVFDKPYTWTSFHIVARVRNMLTRKLGVKKLKVGHAGTLDPLATGILIVCTGKATKQIDELQSHTKEYEATLKIGATTPSFDLETEIDATYPTAHITRKLVEETLKRFVGKIEQVPPTYSAVKINGKRAYEFARSGRDIELKPKTLIIDEIRLTDFNKESDSTLTAKIDVVCSKGTYIRALARDIGQALGSGAHLTALRRTRVGAYTVKDCISIENFGEWLDAQEIEDEAADGQAQAE